LSTPIFSFHHFFHHRADIPLCLQDAQGSLAVNFTTGKILIRSEIRFQKLDESGFAGFAAPLETSDELFLESIIVENILTAINEIARNKHHHLSLVIIQYSYYSKELGACQVFFLEICIIEQEIFELRLGDGIKKTKGD
tara:strand:+ start:364 stop:780 length:417 start_codon:yes stop_codon:yes gene_type:complete